MRLFVWAAAVITLPVALIASTTGVASAKGSTKLDVSAASITCTTVSGTAKLAPHITTALPSAVTAAVHLSLSGCSVTDERGDPVAVTVTGSAKGVLHATAAVRTGDSLTAATTGTLTVKWSSSVKLAAPSSHISIGTVAVDASGTDAEVSFGSPVVSGDFTGASGTGAASTFSATSSQSVIQLATAAFTTGLASIGVASGTLHLG
jgi:hypothetical protein